MSETPPILIVDDQEKLLKLVILLMNRLGFHFVDDPRELSIRQALFRDVLGARPQT